VGFLDALRGKKKLRQPTDDRLFAMSTAIVTLETELNLKSSGKAAIVFQPLGTTDFDAIVKDMEEVLNATGGDTGTTIERRDDSFGYRWMILSDPDFEDLVVGLNAVSSALRDGGYGDRILCALFSFTDEQNRPVHWIYNVKRATFYPFVPAGGEQARDNERELRLKAQLERELPIEQDLGRWFPLWDVPL
jgi:PspAB-like protein